MPEFISCREATGCAGKDTRHTFLPSHRAHVCTERWLTAQQAGGQDKAAIFGVIKHTENYYLKNFT